MVAYQGGVRFEYRVPERGHGGLLQEGLTGEGVKLMTAAGTGDLFLAHDKRKNMILDLGNEQMAVNGTASWLSSRASAGTSNGSRARAGSPAASSTWSSRGAATSAPASGATSRSRSSPATAPGSRSRCPSKVPAVSSYCPRKARLSPHIPTRERETTEAGSARSSAVISPSASQLISK